MAFLQNHWMIIHDLLTQLPRKVLERLLLKLVMLIALRVIYYISLVPLRIIIQRVR